MSNSPDGGLILALWSFPTGAFLCAVYDCVRVARKVFGSGRIAVFVTDLLFCLFSSAVFSVLFFNTVNGKVRLYAIAIAAAGFYVWRKTAGRIVTAAMLRLAEALKRIVSSAARSLLLVLKRIERSLSTFIYCRSTLRAAKSGFGHTPRHKENKNEKEVHKTQ
ncbi:MAG: spore cortex biosynthesis protein YabQ [Clostridia bacterium]|nr:spore cortex biosynthesis protein YabQ [Clostridia bacterium]